MKIEEGQEFVKSRFPRVMKLKGSNPITPIYAIWYSAARGVILLNGERCSSPITDYDEVGSITIKNDGY